MSLFHYATGCRRISSSWSNGSQQSHLPISNVIIVEQRFSQKLIPPSPMSSSWSNGSRQSHPPISNVIILEQRFSAISSPHLQCHHLGAMVLSNLIPPSPMSSSWSNDSQQSHPPISNVIILEQRFSAISSPISNVIILEQRFSAISSPHLQYHHLGATVLSNLIPPSPMSSSWSNGSRQSHPPISNVIILEQRFSAISSPHLQCHHLGATVLSNLIPHLQCHHLGATILSNLIPPSPMSSSWSNGSQQSHPPISNVIILEQRFSAISSPHLQYHHLGATVLGNLIPPSPMSSSWSNSSQQSHPPISNVIILEQRFSAISSPTSNVIILKQRFSAISSPHLQCHHLGATVLSNLILHLQCHHLGATILSNLIPPSPMSSSWSNGSQQSHPPISNVIILEQWFSAISSPHLQCHHLGATILSNLIPPSPMSSSWSNGSQQSHPPISNVIISEQRFSAISSPHLQCHHLGATVLGNLIPPSPMSSSWSNGSRQYHPPISNVIISEQRFSTISSPHLQCHHLGATVLSNLTPQSPMSSSLSNGSQQSHPPISNVIILEQRFSSISSPPSQMSSSWSNDSQQSHPPSQMSSSWSNSFQQSHPPSPMSLIWSNGFQKSHLPHLKFCPHSTACHVLSQILLFLRHSVNTAMCTSVF